MKFPSEVLVWSEKESNSDDEYMLVATDVDGLSHDVKKVAKYQLVEVLSVERSVKLTPK